MLCFIFWNGRNTKHDKRNTTNETQKTKHDKRNTKHETRNTKHAFVE
jgi:hypothetical protein